jgi:hypothetical protein
MFVNGFVTISHCLQTIKPTKPFLLFLTQPNVGVNLLVIRPAILRLQTTNVFLKTTEARKPAMRQTPTSQD